MKKILLTSLLLLQSLFTFSQGTYSTRTYDIIGLADGDKVSECIENGLPFLILGLIIIALSFSSINKKVKETGKDESGSPWGCIGMIIVGISLIIMLPLLAWIEASVVSIISVISIIAIIYFIWNAISK